MRLPARPLRSPLLVLSGARDADRPVAALSQKGDHLLHGVLVSERLRHLVDSLLQGGAQGAAAIEQHLIGAPEFMERLVGETPPLQADDIEPGEFRRGCQAQSQTG